MMNGDWKPVPPTIVDAESSPSHITARENVRVDLSCRGDGVPTPRFTWRREDGRPINLGTPERRNEGNSSSAVRLG